MAFNNNNNSCSMGVPDTKHNKITFAFDKVCKSIATSKTFKHLEGCLSMIVYFDNIYNNEQYFDDLMKWLSVNKKRVSQV